MKKNFLTLLIKSMSVSMLMILLSFTSVLAAFTPTASQTWYVQELKTFLNETINTATFDGTFTGPFTATELKDLINNPSSNEFATLQDLIDAGVVNNPPSSFSPNGGLVFVVNDINDLNFEESQFLGHLQFLFTNLQSSYPDFFENRNVAVIDESGDMVVYGAQGVITNPAQNVPIDGGLAYLAIAGIGVAVTRFRRRN